MKTFPIQGVWIVSTRRQLPASTIPWDMIAPHEAQALANHAGQSLEHLAGRGGLSHCEAVAVLEDRKWHKMEQADSITKLGELVARWALHPESNEPVISATEDHPAIYRDGKRLTANPPQKTPRSDSWAFDVNQMDSILRTTTCRAVLLSDAQKLERELICASCTLVETIQKYETKLREMNELETATRRSLMSEIGKRQTFENKVKAAFGLDTPWPLHNIIERLADAAQHLHDAHDCDRDGYEADMEVTQLARGLMPALKKVVEAL